MTEYTLEQTVRKNTEENKEHRLEGTTYAQTPPTQQPLLRGGVPDQREYYGDELRFDSDLGRCL